jgi:hypothetical protein
MRVTATTPAMPPTSLISSTVGIERLHLPSMLVSRVDHRKDAEGRPDPQQGAAKKFCA